MIDPQLQKYATDREWDILTGIAAFDVSKRHVRRVKATVIAKAALAGWGSTLPSPVAATTPRATQ